MHNLNFNIQRLVARADGGIDIYHDIPAKEFRDDLEWFRQNPGVTIRRRKASRTERKLACVLSGPLTTEVRFRHQGGFYERVIGVGRV